MSTLTEPPPFRKQRRAAAPLFVALIISLAALVFVPQMLNVPIFASVPVSQARDGSLEITLPISPAAIPTKAVLTVTGLTEGTSVPIRPVGPSAAHRFVAIGVSAPSGATGSAAVRVGKRSLLAALLGAGLRAEQ